MSKLNITGLRLANQKLSASSFKSPAEVVGWMGAVQSQDYAGAKWAVALRAPGLTDADIEQAFTDGKILRTHVMRPTWHFILPEDIHWMLELTAPRVLAAIGYMDRQLGLDKIIIRRSNAALAKALQGGNQLTRSELGAILQRSRVNTDDLRLGHLLAHAEVDRIICSGGRRGKQFTYALLDERAPQARTLKRDEALAELTSRYFVSHGPATLQDFVWWSGLTTADARDGLEMNRSRLIQETVNDQTYWLADSTPLKKAKSLGVFLLPNYDEYTVSYTDRSAIFDVAHTDKLDSRGSILFQYVIVLDGQIVGTWKRTLKKNEVAVEIFPYIEFTKAEKKTVAAAADRFGNFLGLPLSLAYVENKNE